MNSCSNITVNEDSYVIENCDGNVSIIIPDDNVINIISEAMQGPMGVAGPVGPAGPGIAAGGLIGQVLIKNSNANYDTAWQYVNGGVTSFNSRTGAVQPTLGDYNTSLVPENTNLYFTTARAIAALTGQNISLFNNNAGYVSNLSTFNTDNLNEGTSNLYYTNTRARAALSAVAPLIYTASTGVFTISQATTSTNGYLSSADWNTFNNKQAALPSFTTKQILYGNGTPTPQTNSNYTFDSSTNRVTSLGSFVAGTTTPNSTTAVFYGKGGVQTAGISNSAMQLEQQYVDLGGSDLVGAGINFNTTNGSSGWICGGFAATIGNPGVVGGYPGGLAMYVKGADGSPTGTLFEAARFDYLGNLGLNTKSATAKLDVNGSARFRSFIYDSSNSAGISGNYLINNGSGATWASAPAAITALTGDGSATGPGSVAFTLATVNSNIGTFGSASQVMQQTVNAKGLTTAASNISIQIAESQVTNLTTDLASKQPQLNGTGFVKASGTTISYDNSTYQPAYSPFTTGQILFGNGTSTPAQDPKNFWDNINKRYGVGTNTPLSNFHSQTNDGTGVAFLMTGTASDGSIDNSNGAAILMGHNSGGNRQIVLCDSSSKVGLRVLSNSIDGFDGTTNSRLDLYLGTATSDIRINRDAYVTGNITAASHITQGGTTSQVVSGTGSLINTSSFAAAGNYITALTGDATATGPGSVALTLATVNSNIGTFNNLTVNGKGLVIAASNISYQPAYSNFTANQVLYGNTTSSSTPAQSSGFSYDPTGGLLTTSTGVVSASGSAFNFGSNGSAQWDVDTSGNLLALTTNTYDFGNTTNKVKNVYIAGKVGINNTAAIGASLHIKSIGTGASLTAPIKINGGTLMTGVEDGAMEYDGTHLYFSVSASRYQLDRQTAYAKVTATDANTTISAVNTLTVLPATITANRTLAVPFPALFTGEQIQIQNLTSVGGAFQWTFVGTNVTDTNGTSITVVPSSSLITLRNSGSKWVIADMTPAYIDTTTTTITMTPNTTYYANNASLVTLTLPAVFAQDAFFRVVGKGAGGWTIGQASGQTIHISGLATTTGTGGSLSSTNQYDVVTLRGVTASTTLSVESSTGTLTRV